MIIFQNKGLIVMDAVTTFGVSAKESTNPFGKFGTGIKYAIAVILRGGGTIDIWRGGERYEFSVQPKGIRGKDFNIVTMNGEPLGFTTEYGKTWEPWQAYRELYCNAKDEVDGRVYRVEEDDFDEEEQEAGRPRPDTTTIVVTGPEIEQAHKNRHTTILQTDPLFVLNGVEVHAGKSEFLFYQGIRVHKLAKSSKFTYNLTTHQDLTEDRTLIYGGYYASHTIGGAIVQSTQRPLIEEVLTSDGGWFEGNIPYNEIKSIAPSQQFIDIAEELRGKKLLKGSAINLFHAYANRMESYGYQDSRIVEPTLIEQEVIDNAKALVRNRGVDLMGLHVVVRSGEEHSYVTNGIMTLPARCLNEGRDSIARELIRGAALINGGRVDDQLVNFVLTGTFLPRPAKEEAA